MVTPQCAAQDVSSNLDGNNGDVKDSDSANAGELPIRQIVRDVFTTIIQHVEAEAVIDSMVSGSNPFEDTPESSCMVDNRSNDVQVYVTGVVVPNDSAILKVRSLNPFDDDSCTTSLNPFGDDQDPISNSFADETPVPKVSASANPFDDDIAEESAAKPHSNPYTPNESATNPKLKTALSPSRVALTTSNSQQPRRVTKNIVDSNNPFPVETKKSANPFDDDSSNPPVKSSKSLPIPLPAEKTNQKISPLAKVSSQSLPTKPSKPIQLLQQSNKKNISPARNQSPNTRKTGPSPTSLLGTTGSAGIDSTIKEISLPLKK